MDKPLKDPFAVGVRMTISKKGHCDERSEEAIFWLTYCHSVRSEESFLRWQAKTKAYRPLPRVSIYRNRQQMDKPLKDPLFHSG